MEREQVNESRPEDERFSENIETFDSQSTTSQKLDLSKYKTPELVDRIVEVINLPSSLASVLIWALCLALGMALFCYLISFGGLSIGWIVGLVLFGVLTGGVSGLILGLVRLANRTLENINQVLNIVLDTALMASKDYQGVESGTTTMPTASELSIASYEQVVLPSIEQAALSAFGFLAKPFIWAYKISLNRAVKFMLGKIAYFEKKSVTDQKNEKLKTVLQKASKYNERIQKTLSPVRNFVDSIGKKFRFVIAIPMYLIFFAVLFLSFFGALFIRLLAAFLN